jgi:hypothetical protein
MPGHDEVETAFRAYRTAFRREAQRLGMFVALYRYLHECRHDRLEELNLAPAFFQTVLTALRSGIVAWSHKFLVGGSRQEVSMGTFLNFTGQHLVIFGTEAFRERRGLAVDAWQVRNHIAPTTEAVRLDRRRLAALTALPSLRVLRDKFHAHFDPQYFLRPEELDEAAPLTWGELTEIRRVIEDILNRYSVAFDGDHFVFDPLNQLDVEHVITALHEHRER